MTSRLIIGLTACVLASSAKSPAAIFNWDGSTDGSWANPANWAEGTPTSAVDTALIFSVLDQPATANDLGGGLTLNSLLFGPGAGARTVTGNSLIFSGTTPTLISQSTDPADVRISVPINLAQTLTITGGPNFDAQLLFTASSGFSGTGGITWAGGVGLTAAASTFTGVVQILGGAFGTTNSSALGASPSVSVAAGGSFQLQNLASINKPLSLAGNGFGTSGALAAANGGGTWAGAVTLVNHARISAFENSTLGVNGSVALGANTLTVDSESGGAVRIFGAITGTGGMTKTGGGTLLLPSGVNSVPTNTYTGPTLISGGLVRVARNNAFGSSSLITVQAGAEIELNSRTNGIGNPSGASTVTQPLNLAGRLSAGAPISPFDGFIQTWSGPITLTGDAEFRAVGGSLGGTERSTLQASGSIALNAFTLKLVPNATEGRAIVRTTGAITGAGALDVVATSGTVALGSSASTFTGSIAVSGNLLIGAGDVFGNAANTVTLKGGSIVSFENNADIVARPWNITGSGGLTLVPSNLVHVIGAAISGPGPLTVTQIGLGTGGNIDLTNSNTFTGGLVVGPGSVVGARTNSALGELTGSVRLSGGALTFLDDFTLPASRAVTIDAAGGRFSAPVEVTGTVSANLTGEGAVTIAGGTGGALGGTVVLSGTNSHAGGVIVSTATLALDTDARIGAPGGPFTLGSISGTIVRPGRLLALDSLQIAATRTTSFSRAIVDSNGFSVTFNQPITGTGLTKDGLGILRLNTANSNPSISNPVAINGGSIVLGVNDALGTGARVTVAAGTNFELNGFDHSLLAVEGPGDVKLGAGTLTMRAFSGSVIDGVISGSGGVILETGSFRFGGANTFSGGLTIRNGAQLVVLNTSGFGQTGNPVVLDAGGISTTTLGAAPVVLDASIPLTIGAGGARFSSAGFSLVVASALNGSAPISISGGSDTDEVRFTNLANTFVSNLQIGTSGSDAVLGITGNGALGAATNVVTLGDRFFDGETVRTAEGILRAFDNLTLPASRALSLNGSGSQGGGVFDTNGFTVRVEGAISELRAGIGFEKRGAGTLYLNGLTAYTGTTTVREGELGGSGSVADLRVENGAALSPGDGTGTFTTGDVAFQGGSIFALDFASASSGDQLMVGNSLSLEGDVQLALRLGYSVAGLNTFTVLLNTTDASFPTGGGLFAIGDNQLEQGEAFTAAGAIWTISYIGGDGNDVVLTVVPEPSTLAVLSVGLLLATRRRRRKA